MTDAVFRRDWSSPVPRVVRASGIELLDADGRRYLDAVSGIYVANIGYGLGEIGAAMARQAAQVPFVYAGDFATEAETTLAERVVALAPDGLAKAYFTSGGSEANEVAFKIARRYQRAGGNESRWRIASRWQSYHGATMATLAASGKVSRRRDFLPYMLDFPKLPAVSLYRAPLGLTAQAYGEEQVREVERRLIQEDPASIAAIIIEPVTGAGSGALVPPPGYIRGLRALCDRHDILLIADEVVTGFGRTGAAFASSNLEALPDIITFGKGVAAGYAPLAGVLISSKVIERLERAAPSSLFTGYTYSGHAVSCAAGLAVLDYLDRHDLIAQVRKRESAFLARAQAAFGRHQLVGDIRGKGALMGIEFVADRESRAPLDPALGFHRRVVEAARGLGLLVRGEAGVVDGVSGDHVLVAPAFNATEAELDEIFAMLAVAIEQAARSLH